MPSFNSFFDKIFVINLFDREDRWKKVKKQFDNRNIKIERFVAVDGRCTGKTDKDCLDKLKTFELTYNVYIPYKNSKIPIKELVPASSLTIGTILMLRAMVRNKWDYILVCEDDIVLSRDIEKKFDKGIRELTKKKKSWDLLFLGCGQKCGNKLVSDKKFPRSVQSNLGKILDEDIYVRNKDDLRMPCDECKNLTDSISITSSPGGTWCYAYSLRGAKRALRLFDAHAAGHIDQLLMKLIEDKKLVALAFDPPIVYHEGGVIRAETDIPWKW